MVKANAKKQTADFDWKETKYKYVNHAFMWDRSPEGYSFWFLISKASVSEELQAIEKLLP